MTCMPTVGPMIVTEAPGLARLYRRLFALYLAFIACVTVLYGIVNVRIRSGWAIGEWLINYRAGFVRRGLTGEIALPVADTLRLPPVYVVLLMQLFFYAVAFFCVWRLVANTNWDLWVVAILVSPATLAFHVLDPTSGFRKEDILFAGLGTLLVVLLRRPLRDVWLTVSLSLFGVFCALSHEPLVLFTPYLFAALAIGFHSVPRAIKVGILPIMLTVAAAALAARHPGTPQMAVRICSSLGYSDPASLPGLCNGAIAYLGRDSGFARHEVALYIQLFHYYRLYAVLVVLAGLPVAMAWRALWPCAGLRRDLLTLAAMALASIAASTPLFIYAGDWGRWIYIHLFCIFLLLLFIDHRRQSDPATAGPPPGLPPSLPKRLAVALLLIAYATCWDLPHIGTFRPRFGYFGLARYLYQYRSLHPPQTTGETSHPAEGQPAARISAMAERDPRLP